MVLLTDLHLAPILASAVPVLVFMGRQTTAPLKKEDINGIILPFIGKWGKHMDEERRHYHQTAIGPVEIVENGEAITGLFFCKSNDPPFICGENALIRQAIKELDEYFAGKRRIFTLPVQPSGTEFQKKVWRALCDIPYGETRSYGQIARAVGNPKACRAVGMANHRNPISIVIPCHRVIGADGSLTGYGGGLRIKETLLELERMNSRNRL